ncbi:WAS/WASL-interacting protein family member 1-like isoform X2 [Dermacentor albipictus]|uniref:WAS/WASL-interacting protein family member 1-like isoform X2 n=1 Tax=Dermacentor albipictus TaxID=60249 RepID=UPI0031FDACF6
MYATAHVGPGAEDMSEDEEASLVQERDRTLRTALDQIQQRRRAPANPPSPPPAVDAIEHQFKECHGSSDAAVDGDSAAAAKPSPPQGPLEALRQREWLLNLQEQQELQRLKVALSSPVQQELTEEKEEQLLFNGEVPPLLPVQSTAAALCTTTASSTCTSSTSTHSTTSTCSTSSSSQHSTCTTTSATCPSNSARSGPNRGSTGGRGRGGNRSRPPCVHHNSRGRPFARREHPQQGGRWGHEHRLQSRENLMQQMPNERDWVPSNPSSGSTPTHAALRPNGVPTTTAASNPPARPANNSPKTMEPPVWQQGVMPLSVQDEASMLAQAIELSRLDEGAASIEEEQLRMVLEQSRQEARGRGGGGNNRRGAPRFPRRGWGAPGRGGGAERHPQMEAPLPPVPPNLLNRITIVGSIDAGRLTSGAMPPPLPLVQPPPAPPPSSPNAEPTVTFDQWLSLCSRYMPLLAQGMVELQRTCAAVRSAAPSLDGAPLLLPPPPLWSSRFPPGGAQSPLSSMAPPMTPPMNSITSPMAPPPMGPSHMAPADGGIFNPAPSAFQCIPQPARPPRPVRGAGHNAGLHQKNVQQHHQQVPAAHVGKRQHLNEQVHIGGQSSGDVGHRLHQKNMQQHPHQPSAAANASRKQQPTEQVHSGGQGSDDTGHRQLQKPAQQQPLAANMGSKQHTSEQPRALCRGGARTKKKRKGGKPTSS